MDARVGVIIIGIRVRIGADFSDQALNIIELGIIGNNLVKAFEIFIVVIEIFAVFVPGNKIETDIALGGGGEEGFDPIGIISGDGRAADFIFGVASAVSDPTSSLNVESGIIWVFIVMPTSKKIWLVPNFIINSRNLAIHRKVFGCGFDEEVPLIPVFGFTGILTVFGHIIGGIGK